MNVPLEHCPARHGALHYPERPAWLGPQQRWSYRQLDRHVSTLCRRLHAHDLRPGNALVVIADPAATLLLLLAALRLRLVLAPLNGKLPAAMLSQQLAHFQRGGYYAPAQPLGTAPLISLPSSLLADLEHERDEPAERPVRIDPAQPLTAVFTSGSSGDPKAAVHSYGNHYHSALGSQCQIPLQPGDRWLVSLPLYHVGGLAVLFRCLQAGATLVPLTSQRQLAETLCHQQISHLSLVPTQLTRLLPDWQRQGLPASLRYLLLGGSAIPPALVRRCNALGVTPFVSYGLTEMSSQVCTAPANTAGTVGAVLPGRELSLDARGQILVRGQTLFLGYLRDGTLHRPLTADGWFATRDRGHWQGRELVVDGRLDNGFVSGGENVQPEWIEQQLLTLEAIRRVLVVPLPDPEWGHVAVAFIDAPGTSLALLAQRTATLLQGHLRPKYWLPWPTELDSGLKPNRRRFTALAGQRLGVTGQPPSGEPHIKNPAH